jgi:hypothetical protein
VTPETSEPPARREPRLTLHAGGHVTLRARKGSANVEGAELFWELPPAHLRSLHAAIDSVLRATGDTLDPADPWFTGLVIEGEVLAELRALVYARPRSLSQEWTRDRAVLDRVRLLIEQHDERLMQHVPQRYVMPTPDLDPDSC